MVRRAAMPVRSEEYGRPKSAGVRIIPMFRVLPPARVVRGALLAFAAIFVSPFSAEAQSGRTSLPP
jgi:hypothetical protein